MPSTPGRVAWPGACKRSNRAGHTPSLAHRWPVTRDRHRFWRYGRVQPRVRTAYDAESGKRLWRFYTVPGNPAKGFENHAMEMAAKTWRGKWWQRGGGGGDVWNTMAYDAETDTVFIGTGNGYAANRQVRSENWGDNLFISSIIALDRRTGALKWYYQTTPGDTWDFDAIEDIEFTDLTIGGKAQRY